MRDMVNEVRHTVLSAGELQPFGGVNGLLYGSTLSFRWINAVLEITSVSVRRGLEISLLLLKCLPGEPSGQAPESSLAGVFPTGRFSPAPARVASRQHLLHLHMKVTVEVLDNGT